MSSIPWILLLEGQVNVPSRDSVSLEKVFSEATYVPLLIPAERGIFPRPSVACLVDRLLADREASRKLSRTG